MRELCGEDCALQEEVESLLAADADKASILDHDPDRDLRGRVFDAVASALEDATCVTRPRGSPRRLRDFRLPRPRRHGRGLPGERYEAQPRRRAKDPAERVRDRSGSTRAIPAGSASARVAQSPNIGHIYGLEDGVAPHALVLEFVQGDYPQIEAA